MMVMMTTATSTKTKKNRDEKLPVVLLKQHEGQVVLSLHGGGVHLKHEHVASAEADVVLSEDAKRDCTRRAKGVITLIARAVAVAHKTDLSTSRVMQYDNAEPPILL